MNGGSVRGCQGRETGCGVGAPPAGAVANGPGARFACVDISAASVGAAATCYTVVKGVGYRPGR
ncbi:MAG TPA: hypothetical protein VK997_03685 [Deferrisomatales bacterium]|nr:hypothetical protein [Deferrisomatales bacterium]